jgi:hypothetical protein
VSEVLSRALSVLTAVALVATTGCADSRPRPVTILTSGCVTASGDQFVLTDLERVEAEPSLQHARVGSRPYSTTEAYLLTGADAQLDKLVGRRARVAGEADPAQIAEIRTISPIIRVGTARDAGGSRVSPAVADQEVLRMEIHRLRVISAAPTGDPCVPAASGSSPVAARRT